MLGETYEFVDTTWRFFGEQVSHHPPISAFCFEGKGYSGTGHSELKQSFKFGGGTGCLSFEQLGKNIF